MTLALPQPAPKYDPASAARTNQVLQVADGNNRKKGADVELAAERLIIRSPNGTRYQILVSNSGALSTAVAVP